MPFQVGDKVVHKSCVPKSKQKANLMVIDVIIPDDMENMNTIMAINAGFKPGDYICRYIKRGSKTDYFREADLFPYEI